MPDAIVTPALGFSVASKLTSAALKIRTGADERRRIVRPGDERSRLAGGQHGPATMFFDPIAKRVKLSLRSDVVAPDRLMIESVVLRFQDPDVLLQADVDGYAERLYINDRKNLHVAFGASEHVNALAAGSNPAWLYVRYVSEAHGRKRVHHVRMACAANGAVRASVPKPVALWQLGQPSYIGARAFRKEVRAA